MIVSELIETLEQLPPDAEVILAADPEGNWFSGLADIGFNYLDDEDSPVHPEDEHEYDLTEASRAVILWP